MEVDIDKISGGKFTVSLHGNEIIKDLIFTEIECDLQGLGDYVNYNFKATCVYGDVSITESFMNSVCKIFNGEVECEVYINHCEVSASEGFVSNFPHSNLPTLSSFREVIIGGYIVMESFKDKKSVEEKGEGPISSRFDILDL